jgi:hypothetical protein
MPGPVVKVAQWKPFCATLTTAEILVYRIESQQQ